MQKRMKWAGDLSNFKVFVVAHSTMLTKQM